MQKLYKNKTAKEILKLAKIYDSAKDETSKLSPEFISDLNQVIDTLYHRFVLSSCKVEFVDGQPYETLIEMQTDFFKKGILKISKDFNDSPIFEKEQNLYNRAFHDYLHCILDAKFTFEGEKRVYEATCNFLNSEFHAVLYSEFVLQTASTVYHGGKFPVQKIVLNF